MLGQIVIPDDFPGYPVDSVCIPKRFVNDLDHVLIPQGFIRDRTKRMAEQIANEMGNEPLVALCVLKGSYRFYCELLEEMKNYDTQTITLEFMRMKSYIGTQSCGEVVVGQEVDLKTFKNTNLLIIEDIVDTGSTMHKMMDVLNRPENKPKSIKVATLLWKRNPASNGFTPDFSGFSIPDRFVVGCGFDYNELFRNLNHICVLNDAGIARHSVTAARRSSFTGVNGHP